MGPNLMYWGAWSSEKTLFTPWSNFWANAVRPSGVLNLEPFNFSSCGLGNQSVSGTLECTLNSRPCPSCNELPALEQA